MSTCKNCKFWEGQGEQGACHRFPPTAAGVVMQQTLRGQSPTPVFSVPVSHESYWCGEFTAKLSVLS